MIRVLFVCMGNICRSPTAEGVFRNLVEKHQLFHQIEIDSAGTHGHYHEGETPDRRSQSAALKRGYDLSSIRSRPLDTLDFKEFDYIIAMDEQNLSNMKQICPEKYQDRLFLFLKDFAPQLNVTNVPDPYYDSEQGFEYVLDLIEVASRSLLDQIRKKIK